jgi:dinuclear metal center YbgI/SA1388 family protein
VNEPSAARAASVTDIARWIDEVTDANVTPDYSGALNGLQVDARGPVRRVAAAVDASLRTIELTVRAEANLLLVHHGLFWGGAQRITGAYQQKLRLLMQHDIAVYSSHLPLDRHPTLGNNALLARALGLPVTGTWLPYKGVDIGVLADCELPTSVLAERARAFAAVHGHHAVTTAHMESRVSRRVAVCTGGGASSDSLRHAIAVGADTLIVGEGPHHTAVEAEELGLVVIYAGHYATETLGVQALAHAVADRWQVPWSFVAAPTGL